jgi:hypothetical protein
VKTKFRKTLSARVQARVRALSVHLAARAELLPLPQVHDRLRPAGHRAASAEARRARQHPPGQDRGAAGDSRGGGTAQDAAATRPRRTGVHGASSFEHAVTLVVDIAKQNEGWLKSQQPGRGQNRCGRSSASGGRANPCPGGRGELIPGGPGNCQRATRRRAKASGQHLRIPSLLTAVTPWVTRGRDQAMDTQGAESVL